MEGDWDYEAAIKTAVTGWCATVAVILKVVQ